MVERKSKYIELLKAIEKRAFPIIVMGPNRAGKTHAIINALNYLGLKYKYVELSESKVNKPLGKECIIHVVLYKFQDLNNIKYDKNLIIETTLHGIDGKFNNCTTIKFNQKIFKEKAKLEHKKYKEKYEYQLDIFRFIGRIFYKKLKVQDLESDEHTIYYHCSKVSKDHETANLANIVDTKENFKNEKADEALPRKFILEESESTVFDEPNTSISFEEDYIFDSSDDNTRIVDNDDSISVSVTKLKKLISTDFKYLDCAEEYNISFDINIIERFIYENFPYFIKLEDIPAVYDSLSLIGLHKKFFLNLIGSILKSKANEKSKFFSFKLKPQLNAAEPTVRGMWQYQFGQG